MTKLAAIRGWVEGDVGFDAPIRAIVERHRSEYESASPGWKLGPPVGYVGYWGFGACMNSPELTSWFRAQLNEIAALEPLDDDGDSLRGFFLVSRELDPVVEWHLRDGAVTEVMHDGRLGFLDA